MTTIYDCIELSKEVPNEKISLRKFRCNECGTIFMSEDLTTHKFGQFIKNKSCPYCKHLGVTYYDNSR
jgi:DNA-directed RNA polymerase subunit RPC12/RpoP